MFSINAFAMRSNIKVNLLCNANHAGWKYHTMAMIGLFDVLMQERRNSIAHTLELHLSSTKPLFYFNQTKQNMCSKSQERVIAHTVLQPWNYVLKCLTHQATDRYIHIGSAAAELSDKLDVNIMIFISKMAVSRLCEILQLGIFQLSKQKQKSKP